MFPLFTVCCWDKALSAPSTCSSAIRGALHYTTSRLVCGQYGCRDISRHSCAAWQKLFVIKCWSSRQEGGGGESKQLHFPIISAFIESGYWWAMMCVSIWPELHLPRPDRQAPTVRAGWRMRRELLDDAWKVVMGDGVEDGSGHREKCRRGEMNEDIYTGNRKLCKTWRTKPKEREENVCV